MHRLVPTAILVSLVGSAAPARPQTPADLSSVPAFKAGVDLVRLDVEVAGSDGKPIRDLRQDEFEIIEGGKPRPILLFQHIEEPTSGYPQSIGGEISTNRGAPRGHLYVIVFDQQHILAGHEQLARQAAQRFLRSRIRPGDSVAAYALPGPGVHIGFTGDLDRVAAGLAGVRGLAEPQELGVLGTMTLQEAFRITRGDEITLRAVADRSVIDITATDATGRLGESDRSRTDGVREDARTIVAKADAESRRMLAMFADVLRPLRDVEGRKTVLLFSEGFDGMGLRQELDAVAAAAAESYSTIDAIDLSRRTGDTPRGMPATVDPGIAIHDAMTTLGSLAAETSGHLVLDANGRLDRVLNEVADRSQDYYLVGFTPQDTARASAGSYRRVSVHVQRKGARVSARTGVSVASQSAPIPRREAFDRAITAPFPLQGLPVQYTTYVMRGSAGSARIVLSLEAALPVASSLQTAPAEVVFVVKTEGDGRIAASGTDAIELPEHPDPGATTGTASYHVQFDVPEGRRYLMRAIVRGPNGLVGSADRRLTVPRLDTDGPACSDLFLTGGRSGPPVRPIAYMEDGLSGVLELYSRTPELLASSMVTFDLASSRDAEARISGTGVVDPPRTVADAAVSTARLELPLRDISPGTYVVHAVVRTGARAVTEVSREVDIKPGHARDDRRSDVAFEPGEIVRGALAREYLGALGRSASPALPHARRGFERLAASDFSAAIESLRAALDADESVGATAFFLGWAYYGAGDSPQAITSWRRAAFVAPTLVPAYLALADTYVRLAHPELAIQALRAGLTALPQSPELLERLARIEP